MVHANAAIDTVCRGEDYHSLSNPSAKHDVDEVMARRNASSTSNNQTNDTDNFQSLQLIVFHPNNQTKNKNNYK
jgi:hypothetical protein